MQPVLASSKHATHKSSRFHPGALGFRALLLPLLLLAAAEAPAASAPDRPNVLFIAIDDLNDWVGPLGGHPQAQTPHMDRLARRGVTFLNAHCQAPLCNPSRTSVLTGLRPTTTGVYGLDPWFRSSPRWRDRLTLPQHFARHGYRTVTTGKIFHDAYPPPEGRTDGPEFGRWGLHGGFSPRPARKLVQTPSPNPLVDWGPWPGRDEETFDFDVADYAVAQIGSLAADSQPFFLAVGFRHPHVPCYAPQRWFDLYPGEDALLPPVPAGDRDDVPPFAWHLHWKLPEPRLPWLQRSGQWRPLVRAYLASVSFADAMVGRVLDALRERRLEENTVLVLWSDHGWHLGEKDITGKNSLWEPSTRVPLLFAGPGIRPGAVCRQPAELLDLFPTLAELCGLPSPSEPLDGHSLAPQLRDAAAPRPWPAITTHGPGNHAVRSETHRYIRYADGSAELYALADDPHEWHNLAGDPSVQEVERELARWLPAREADPLPGSRTRLIEYRDGEVRWEGSPVPPGAAVPMDEDAP